MDTNQDPISYLGPCSGPEPLGIQVFRHKSHPCLSTCNWILMGTHKIWLSVVILSSLHKYHGKPWKRTKAIKEKKKTLECKKQQKVTHNLEIT